MNETGNLTETGGIDIYAHDAGMNVLVKRDEFGGMLVCAEFFTYANDGWTDSDVTVVEVTYINGLAPMVVALPGSIVSTFGPRAGF